jgi:diguanylate cyclase (GGDEF)-like protein
MRGPRHQSATGRPSPDLSASQRRADLQAIADQVDEPEDVDRRAARGEELREIVTALRALTHGRWPVRLVVALLSLSLVVGAAWALAGSQTSARRGVRGRFGERAGLAANFVSTYVSALTKREHSVAVRTLTGAHPTAAFVADTHAFGFQAGVLLNAHGQAISIDPRAPTLIGHQFGTVYAHLAVALRGHTAVSNIVTSAVRNAPVVAFAVPFQTPFGRRVFSGAYTISKTPLADFLNDTTTQPEAQVYLTDATNSVLASNGSPPRTVRTLAQRDPALGHATAARTSGNYTSNNESFTFAKRAVTGTPWSLMIVVPTNELYVSVDGVGHWLPWLILVALSVLIGVAALLGTRMVEGRRRLNDANQKLAALARTDSLTGLSNRLYLTEQLDRLLSNASRYAFSVCVLMIDIDSFKALNDTYGHQTGDEALRRIAERLTISLRDGDLLGRWGGEEFLAVLPYTGLDEGLEVAERLRELVAATPIQIDVMTKPISIQTSVGVAVAAEDSLEALVHRADLGLYAAKAAGRNTVRTIGGPVVAVNPTE